MKNNKMKNNNICVNINLINLISIENTKQNGINK